MNKALEAARETAIRSAIRLALSRGVFEEDEARAIAVRTLNDFMAALDEQGLDARGQALPPHDLAKR